MSVPAYADYKESGISWIGKMPSHWRAERLKVLFDLQKRPVRDEDDIVTAFRDGAVTLRKNRREDGFTNALQEIGYQGIRKGDLVIHAMDGFAGAIGVSDSDGKSTPVYSVCKPKAGVSAAYYGRLLRYMALSGFVNALAKGVRERSTEFRWSDASILGLPVPPEAEQHAITSFLDRETAKIDALVAEQERLIALLKEKRQAVISHAVTKGLNPNALMKDSGIEWLGQIPAHWETLPLKAVSIGEGTIFIDGDWIESKDISEDGIRYITTGNVGEGFYKEQGSGFITDETFVALNCTEVLPGDVLISRLNLPIGRACVVPDLGTRIVTSVDNVIVRAGDHVNRKFLTFLLSAKSFFAHTETLARGTTMQRISRTVLGNIRICLPAIDEQLEIAESLQEQTAGIDALVVEAQSAISLLQERRAALISAAVTGKIDVRGLAETSQELELA